MHYHTKRGDDNIVERKFGWRPMDVDPRDYNLKHPAIKPFIKDEAVPTSFSLRDKDSPIEDQGAIGSCSSFAGAGALQYYDKQQNAYQNLSQSFIYFFSRMIDNGWDPSTAYNEKYAPTEDSGSTIRSTFKAIAALGDCTEVAWPYTTDDINEKPSDVAMTEAKGYEVTNYAFISENSSKIANMKKAIYSGLPVVFGRNVPNEIYNVGADGVEPYGTDYVGGHAQMAVGYDDTKTVPGTLTKGAFLIRNSWGTNWGDAGYEWVSYKCFQTQQTDCGVIIKANLPTVSPTPSTDWQAMYEKVVADIKKICSLLIQLIRRR